MSTPRKLGIGFCLLGFFAVCALALSLNTTGPFGGLAGLEDELVGKADAIVQVDAPQAVVIAEGRNVSVRLPEAVNATFDRERLQRSLEAIDGVRSVEVTGNPMIALDPDDRPDPSPTVPPEPPEPTPEPEPTAEPTPEPEPTAEPEPEPTTEPEPEPTTEPEPEPTTEPEPTAEPEPLTLAEVVAELDLSAVTFAPGSSRFTAQDIAVLDLVADQLQGLTGGPIEVQAHTDTVGDPDANLLLSQDRADAVVAYLIDRGVDASLLTPRGYGSQLPIADDTTEQGRAANQRVVLVVEGN